MQEISEEIKNIFGCQLRVRVCGICIENEKILLVCHKGLGREGELWGPPGGGLNFGETLEDCLKREFLEETGLEIIVNEFLFINELINKPLHAIEIFFLVNVTGGELQTGLEPEIEEKIINAAKWLSETELNELSQYKKHNIFHVLKTFDEIRNGKGYFHFTD